MKLLHCVFLSGLLLSLSLCMHTMAQEPNKSPTNQQSPSKQNIAETILFHAPFDGTTQAAISQGEGKLLTADAIERNVILGGETPSAITIAKGEGRYGDALRFAAKTDQVVFYEGIECGYQRQNWSGSVSVWLKLDPNKDLEPGYCDPLQITERAWNDAAFFVDFDKFLPRDFRLGVFADLKIWNPKDISWDDLPLADRPMIVVKQPPFSADQWTHVCFTWKHINATDKQVPQADLYLNGKHQGTYTPSAKFTWDPQKAAIMLGLNYIGLMDDLIVFSQELTAAQVARLYQHPVSDLK